MRNNSMGRRNRKLAQNSETPRLRRRGEGRGNSHGRNTFPLVGGPIQFVSHHKAPHRAEQKISPSKNFSVSSPLECSAPITMSSLLGSCATAGPAARKSPGLPNGFDSGSGTSSCPSSSGRSKKPRLRPTPQRVAVEKTTTNTRSNNSTTTGDEGEGGGSTRWDSPRRHNKRLSPRPQRGPPHLEKNALEEMGMFPLSRIRKGERSISPDVRSGPMPEGMKPRMKNLHAILSSSSRLQDIHSSSVVPNPSFSSQGTLSLTSHLKLDLSHSPGGPPCSAFSPSSLRSLQPPSSSMPAAQEPTNGGAGVVGGPLGGGDLYPISHSLAPLVGSGGGEEGGRSGHRAAGFGTQSLQPLRPLASRTASTNSMGSGRELGFHVVNPPASPSSPIDALSNHPTRSSSKSREKSPGGFPSPFGREKGSCELPFSSLTNARASSCSVFSSANIPSAIGSEGKKPEGEVEYYFDQANSRSTSSTHPTALNMGHAFRRSSPASLGQGYSATPRETTGLPPPLSQDSTGGRSFISISPNACPPPIWPSVKASHPSTKNGLAHRSRHAMKTSSNEGGTLKEGTGDLEDGDNHRRHCDSGADTGGDKDDDAPFQSPVLFQTHPETIRNSGGSEGDHVGTHVPLKESHYASSDIPIPSPGNEIMADAKQMTISITGNSTSLLSETSSFSQGGGSMEASKAGNSNSPGKRDSHVLMGQGRSLSSSLSWLPVEVVRSLRSSSSIGMHLSVVQDKPVGKEEKPEEGMTGWCNDQQDTMLELLGKQGKNTLQGGESEVNKAKEKRRGEKKLRVAERKDNEMEKGKKREKKKTFSVFNGANADWEERAGGETDSHNVVREHGGSMKRSQNSSLEDCMPMEKAAENSSPTTSPCASHPPFTANEEWNGDESTRINEAHTGKHGSEKERRGASKKSFRSSASSSLAQTAEPQTPSSSPTRSAPYPSPTAWCIPLTPTNGKSRLPPRRGGGLDFPKSRGGTPSSHHIRHQGNNTSTSNSHGRNESAGGGGWASSTSATGMSTKNIATSGGNTSTTTNGTWRYSPSPLNQHTFYFPEDRLEFSSEFDSGNLIQVERVGAFRYNAYTAMDCANTLEQTNNRQWFHFSIRGASKGGAIVINVVGLLHCKMFTFDWMPVAAIRPGRPTYQRLPGKSIVTPLEQMPPTPGYPNMVYKIWDDLDDSITDFHPGGLYRGEASRVSVGMGDGQIDEDNFSLSTSLHSGTSTGSPAFPGSGIGNAGHHSHLIGGGLGHHTNSSPTTFGSGFPPLPGRPGKPVIAGRKKKKKDFMAMSLAFEIRFDTEIPLKSAYPLGHPNCTAMYVASNHPYSYDTLQRNISMWEVRGQRKPNVTSSPTNSQMPPCTALLSIPAAPLTGAPIYFHREVLCKTLDGLNVDLLVITDRTGMQHERMPLMSIEHGIPFSSAQGWTERPHKFDGKVFVVLTARVHPGECPSSHMIHGCIEFLLHNTDSRAACLRQKCVFFIVPMINPDGVVRGHSRTDARGVDLNRMYREPSFSQHPAPFCIRMLLNQLAAEKKLGLYIDMHAHANKKGTFFYGNSMPPFQQIPALLYTKLVALNSPYFEFSSCNFTETNMYATGKAGKGKDTSGRVVVFHDTGLPLSFTIEASHVAGKTFSPIATVPAFVEETQETQCAPNSLLRYTPNSFADTGRALLLAFLDFRGWNPFSRIPFGVFHSLRGVMLWLHRQLQTELTERILQQGTKTMNLRADSSDSSLMYQTILSTLTPEDIPDKVTIRDSRSLPAITMKGVKDFLSPETAARGLLQTVTSGVPRSLVSSGPPRRGNGGSAPMSLGSPRNRSSPIHFHDLL